MPSTNNSFGVRRSAFGVTGTIKNKTLSRITLSFSIADTNKDFLPISKHRTPNVNS